MTGLKNRFVSLLRWSERYTKTDMVYLAKGGFWIQLGQVVYIPLALVLSVAFANLVPKEVYGTYRFVLSLATIVGVFALTGIDSSIPQAVARGYEGMLRNGFKTYLKWSWMMLAAAGVGATYYFFHGNTLLGYALLIAGSCTPIFAGASLYGDFLVGRREFRLSTLLGALQMVFTTVCMIATMLVVKDALALVAAYFVSNMVSALALYLYTVRRFRPNAAIDPESIRFGFHLSAANVLSTVADQLDQLLVFHLFGAAQLAEYAFAIAIPEYLRSSSKVFNTLAIPKFAQSDRAALSRSLLPKILMLCLILLGVALVYIIAAPHLFKLFYPHYLASVPYSQVYAFVIIAGAGSLPGAALTSQRAVREQYILSITNNVLRIALLAGLSLAFGLWGIIYARLIGKFAALIITTVLARRMS